MILSQIKRLFLAQTIALLLILQGISLPATADNILGDLPYEEPEFLEVHEAFKATTSLETGKFKIDWLIAEGYYLYQPRFSFKFRDSDPAELLPAQYSREGKLKNDEVFGEIAVFYHDVVIDLPYRSQQGGEVELTIKFQGCAEAGLCYPPTKLKKVYQLPPHNPDVSSVSEDSNNSSTTSDSSQPQIAASTSTSSEDKFSASGIVAMLAAGGISSLAIMFLLGIGLTFTPCILPMVPILSSVIVGQKEEMTTSKGFVLSLTYVLGMSLTYAVAGYIFGLTGAKFQIIMQAPVVLWTFAGLFILLSLSMFGFYELQLPSGLQNRLNDIGNNQKGGQLIGVFIMGIIAALVASPCISAPLAGALMYIAQTGDPTYGALALFSLGLGIGTPLIILGTTGGNVLPKAGMWMDSVKALFGVLMLFVATYLVKHLVPAGIMMMIWASLLIIPAIYMGALHTVEDGWPKLWKGVGIIMLIYGTTLILGALSGNTNPFQPLGGFQVAQNSGGAKSKSSTQLAFQRVRTVSELDTALAAAKDSGKPAMIDYYADWCIACIEMEHAAFQDAVVFDTLRGHSLIQIDLTNNDDADALLDRYNLLGPPSILFFDSNGEEISNSRVVGEMKSLQFRTHVQKYTQQG